MQGLVRRVVTQLPRCHTNCHRIFNNHYAFSSVPKPQLQDNHIHTHILSNLLTHPLHHFHSSRSLSSKFPTFHSFHRFFAFNSLLRLSATDCKPGLRFFRQHNFNFSHYQDFSRRSSWRSWLHRLIPNDVVLGLIVTNVAIFLLWRIADERFMIKNFTISLDNFKSGRLHTLITNAFSHIDTSHLVSNMVGLYFFGMSVGRNFGTEFLLKLYLAGAIGGSVFYLIHQAYKAQTSKDWGAMIASKELALGASGAVNAVMLLDIFLFPKNTLYLNFIIPVPAILLGIFLIGKDMLRILEGDSRISGSSHLGGAAVAAIAWAGVRRGRF